MLIIGHNLVALYAAIEEQTLVRVRAHPDLAKDIEHNPDSFATGIQLLKLAPVRAGAAKSS